MSLGQLDHLHPDEPAPFGPASHELEPGRYLTDERRLYRVISRFAVPGEIVLVVLEDCVTLEPIPFVPNELGELGMRAVAA